MRFAAPFIALIGFGLIVEGIRLIYVPAALIFAGLAFVTLAVGVTESVKNRK